MKWHRCSSQKSIRSFLSAFPTYLSIHPAHACSTCFSTARRRLETRLCRTHACCACITVLLRTALRSALKRPPGIIPCSHIGTTERPSVLVFVFFCKSFQFCAPVPSCTNRSWFLMLFSAVFSSRAWKPSYRGALSAHVSMATHAERACHVLGEWHQPVMASTVSTTFTPPPSASAVSSLVSVYFIFGRNVTPPTRANNIQDT